MISHRLIRLSSPKLNYIIGIGAVILYLNVIFLVVPTINPVLITVLCHVCSIHVILTFTCTSSYLHANLSIVYILRIHPPTTTCMLLEHCIYLFCLLLSSTPV